MRRRRASAQRAPLLRIAIALATLVAPAVEAQPYVEGGQTRHRFAQTTIGTDARVFALGDATAQGTLQDARLVIGGTHFWGHADFFVAVPVGWSGTTGFRSGIETGARYYPWRLEQNRLRPYIGASFLGSRYQEVGGPPQTNFHLPITAGLTYQRGSHLLSLNAGWMRHESTYFTAPFVPTDIRMHPGWIGLGYARSFDTTIGAERGWRSGETELRALRALAAGRLDGLAFSVGVSSAFFLNESPQLRDVEYVGQHRVTNVFPELGVGYYTAGRDAQMNIALRSNESRLEGHGYRHAVTRTSLALELFTFIGDYHGFVPFIGPHMSQEWLRVSGDAEGSASVLAYGVTAGWDIRPDPLQAFTVRTTLRWTPNLRVVTDGLRTVRLDQLEVNFVQLVIYPGRIW